MDIDATVWLSEMPAQQPYILDPHAGIACLAILVIFLLAAQLLPTTDAPDDELDDWL